MTKIATITSKKQLTIPAELYRRAKLSEHQKVFVTELHGRLVISPVDDAINELAGILKTPAKWRGKSSEVIILEAKKSYFENRAKR